MHVALLALGDGNCARFPGCVRHCVDGEELGKRNTTYEGSGREVLELNARSDYEFVINISSVIVFVVHE